MKLFAVLCLLIGAACSKPRVVGIRTIEEDEAPLKSAIRSSDPSDEPQFISGVYPVEPDGWRWARSRVSVVLQAPDDGARNGAELEVSLDVPQVVLDRTGPVTVSATVSGERLPPETRSRPGASAYHRSIPAAVLARREVLIDVIFDKAVKPYTLPGEDRELSAILHGVALRKAVTKAGER